MARINLGTAHAGRVHPAAAGDVVVIRLPETPTSGYRWQIEEFDPEVLRPAGEESLAPGTGLGGRGIRELRFAVVAPGVSRVALSLRRAWEGAGSAVERFEATIDVDR